MAFGVQPTRLVSAHRNEPASLFCEPIPRLRDHSQYKWHRHPAQFSPQTQDTWGEDLLEMLLFGFAPALTQSEGECESPITRSEHSKPYLDLDALEPYPRLTQGIGSQE